MPPAARATDVHTCPTVTGLAPHMGGPILQPGHPTTIVGGLPAARIGDVLAYVGPLDEKDGKFLARFVGNNAGYDELSNQ